MTMSRRGFLAASAVAATAAACSASGSANDGREKDPLRATTTTVAPRRRRGPGDRWDPSKPEGTDLLPQIEHIVVVMMENHSFDNYLGMLGRGDGFTLGRDGTPTNSCPDVGGKPV